MKSKLLLTLILIYVSICNYAQPSFASSFLADRHQSRNVSCQQCHGQENSTAEKNLGMNCQKCHGSYQMMVDKTQKKFPEVNPHDQHDGDLSGVVCHKGHKKGVNYCEECHGTFVFEVP